MDGLEQETNFQNTSINISGDLRCKSRKRCLQGDQETGSGKESSAVRLGHEGPAPDGWEPQKEDGEPGVESLK